MVTDARKKGLNIADVDKGIDATAGQAQTERIETKVPFSFN